jgi:hypothetical protein
LAAADPTDPQSWNRYGYVGNRPLNTVDPLGLFDCDPDDKGADCGPIGPDPCLFDISCFPPPCPDCGGGGGGGGGRRPRPRPGPTSPAGGNHGPWLNGETLGLPTGLNLHPMGLAELIGLSPGGNCDWVCMPIGSAFLGTGIPFDPVRKWYNEIFYDLALEALLFSDPGPPRLRRGRPGTTAQMTAVSPATAGQIAGACALIAINLNSELGAGAGDSSTASISPGVNFEMYTQFRRPSTMNPSSPNAVYLYPLAAPGVFVQNSYYTCKAGF